MKIDEAIAAYVALRDKRDALGRKHKDELEPLQTAMEKIESWLQKHLLQEGVESMRTDSGTAFLQRATSATVRDWDTTLEFVKLNNDWSLLEARVNKTAIKDFVESHGKPPPGVNFNETIVTRVRR